MQSDTAKEGGTFIERARRAQIVAAASETIAAEGFARASLTRIAARAQISKGVIFYHFGSKDELVRAVVVETYTGAGTEIAKAVEAAPDHGARLAAYIRGNLVFLADHRTEVQVLNEIFTSFRGEDGRLAYDESQLESVVAPLEAVLRAGQEAGELRAFDRRVMARTIRAAIDAVTPQLNLQPDLDVGAYADELVDTFTRATCA
ncbi:MAG: TetR/AcrR family transcriptional regulator [Nocardioidaceae bacterium]|nr:TetR/AcrR family transcriptional regulator [Nocardioidaceae bacterium]